MLTDFLNFSSLFLFVDYLPSPIKKSPICRVAKKNEVCVAKVLSDFIGTLLSGAFC